MGDASPKRKFGCGLISSLFGRHNHYSRRSISAGSSPLTNNDVKPSQPQSSKWRRCGSDNAINKNSSHFLSNSSPNLQRKQQQHPVKTKATIPSSGTKVSSKVTNTQGNVRKVSNEDVGISVELDSMINDYQKSNGSKTLVRASSSNVMLFGNLGNLRQGGGERESNNSLKNDIMETIGGNRTKEVKNKISSKEQLCRTISTRMDPEQLKIMGNEDYKNGRFAEALALYDAAIAIDPNKASYRSNRSAALASLGRLLEALFECREAIRIEPRYHRAHNRLGNLNFRLGETDKALYHYKQAGPDADPDEIAKVKNLQVHLSKCTEARRLRDWNTLIRETNNAISCGADSAPQIYALQAEALLKLRRHEDADGVMSRCPNYDVDECAKFFGPIYNANFLVTRSRVDMAVGRFEDAVEAAHKAARLDSNNKEANKVMRKTHGVTVARTKGNDLFKASKFSEACIAYGEGLECDPYNSVLLCNRAACRSKLGQFETAVEDCTVALNLRPSYTKARLRRADCNAKLERWEPSIEDYKILLKETPEDEEVKRALLEVQAQLEKRQG